MKRTKKLKHKFPVLRDGKDGDREDFNKTTRFTEKKRKQQTKTEKKEEEMG